MFVMDLVEHDNYHVLGTAVTNGSDDSVKKNNATSQFLLIPLYRPKN
jgi:hypothetical protein